MKGEYQLNNNEMDGIIKIFDGKYSKIQYVNSSTGFNIYIIDTFLCHGDISDLLEYCKNRGLLILIEAIGHHDYSKELKIHVHRKVGK